MPESPTAPRAAVPRYVLGAHPDRALADAPPGHRFNLYFEVWNGQWELPAGNKRSALEKTLKLPAESLAQIEALRQRQWALLSGSPGHLYLSLEARSSAPFATGLGMEHPLENGFAFLNPYGLPYLPGSSIKGVVRRAAELLAADGDSGWAQARVDCLFGPEPRSGDTEADRRRGAISFWDAIPSPPKGSLAMDVMTPHHTSYLEGKSSPHDSGQPNPIVFLTVPVGSAFDFHVTCREGLLDEGLAGGGWKPVLQAAFEHAFGWLGFGAKTAVGYGGMRIDHAAARASAEAEASKRAAELMRQETERLKAMSPIDQICHELASAPEQKVNERYAELANHSGSDQLKLAEALKAAYQRLGKWDGKQGERQSNKIAAIKKILDA